MGHLNSVIFSPEDLLIIKEGPSERRRFIESLFNHNHCKAYHYDLVIRTGPDVTMEDASDIIIDLTKRKFKI